MIKRKDKDTEMLLEDGNDSIELTATTFNDKELDDRRQMMGTDVGVQVELITAPFDDKDTKNRQQIIGKDVGVQVELTAITPYNENAKLDRNSEETHDRRQVVIAMEKSYNRQDPSMIKNRRVVEAVIHEPNLTTTNIIDDIKTDLSPIVEYAQEPLLPLFKACAPLNNILHNLSLYIQLALNETSEQPPDGLTIDESAAIRLYTIEWDTPHQSLYSMLNYTLKNNDREQLRPYFKYLKLFLTALAKLPCVPQLTVWRGVTKNLSVEFPPGTPVTWWAFSSCTASLTVLENNMYLGTTGERTLFSVDAINGRTIRNHSHFDIEEEILLLPGTHMIVQSQLTPARDLYIIHLKQVIPEQVLLEPPFQGIFNTYNHLFKLILFLFLGALLYPKIE
jgi:hypothetical protein